MVALGEERQKGRQKGQSIAKDTGLGKQKDPGDRASILMKL